MLCHADLAEFDAFVFDHLGFFHDVSSINHPSHVKSVRGLLVVNDVLIGVARAVHIDFVHAKLMIFAQISPGDADD